MNDANTATDSILGISLVGRETKSGSNSRDEESGTTAFSTLLQLASDEVADLENGEARPVNETKKLPEEPGRLDERLSTVGNEASVTEGSETDLAEPGLPTGRRPAAESAEHEVLSVKAGRSHTNSQELNNESEQSQIVDSRVVIKSMAETELDKDSINVLADDPELAQRSESRVLTTASESIDPDRPLTNPSAQSVAAHAAGSIALGMTGIADGTLQRGVSSNSSAANALTPIVETLQGSREMNTTVHSLADSELAGANLAFQFRAQSAAVSGVTSAEAGVAQTTSLSLMTGGGVGNSLPTEAAVSSLIAGTAMDESRVQSTQGSRLALGMSALIPGQSLSAAEPQSGATVSATSTMVAGERALNQSDLKLPLNDAVNIEAAELSGLSKSANTGMLTSAVLQTGIESNLASGVSNLSELPNNMLSGLASGTISAPQVSRVDGANLASTAPYTVSLGSEDSEESLSGNVKWMVNDGVKNAVINVTPSGMGPISVKVGIENEQMNVSIIATQGATREALDAMMPRLREQLSQGFDSVRIDVSDGRSDNAKGNNPQQNFNQSRSDVFGNDQSGDLPDRGDSGTDGERSAELYDDNKQNLTTQLASGLADPQTGTALFDAYV